MRRAEQQIVERDPDRMQHVRDDPQGMARRGARRTRRRRRAPASAARPAASSSAARERRSGAMRSCDMAGLPDSTHRSFGGPTEANGGQLRRPTRGQPRRPTRAAAGPRSTRGRPQSVLAKLGATKRSCATERSESANSAAPAAAAPGAPRARRADRADQHPPDHARVERHRHAIRRRQVRGAASATRASTKTKRRHGRERRRPERDAVHEEGRREQAVADREREHPRAQRSGRAARNQQHVAHRAGDEAEREPAAERRRQRAPRERRPRRTRRRRAASSATRRARSGGAPPSRQPATSAAHASAGSTAQRFDGQSGASISKPTGFPTRSGSSPGGRARAERRPTSRWARRSSRSR